MYSPLRRKWPQSPNHRAPGVCRQEESMLQGPALRKSWVLVSLSVDHAIASEKTFSQWNRIKHFTGIILKIFGDSCSITTPSPPPSLQFFQLNPSHSLWFLVSSLALLPSSGWVAICQGLCSRHHEWHIKIAGVQRMSTVLSLSCTLYFH